MSNQSGITAAKDVVEACHSLQEAVVVITLSEDCTQLVRDPGFSLPASPQQAVAAVHEYLAHIFPQPRYAVVQHGEPFFLSFIPDLAPIRQKMLYASTKNTLLQQLGSVFGKQHVLDFTEVAEIHKAAFAPQSADLLALLTAKERDLQHLDSLQNLTLSQKSKELPLMSLDSLFFKIDPALEKVLHNVEGLVVMNIDVESETLVLAQKHDYVPLSELAHTLAGIPTSEPVYILYAYEKVAFIYACPSGCKVKARIMYAANKQGLLNHLKGDFKQPIDQVIEVGDLDEVDVGVFEEKKEEKSSALKFSKPRGPRRR